jgi:hypothetical protein
MPNFRTTIVIKQASRGHLLKPYMDGNAEPSCFRVRRGGGELSIWTISIKRCQEASSNDQREPEDCPISLEELH